MSNTNETTVAEIHMFERAGLGKAPYRVIGTAERTFQACPGEPVKAGGCCKYCYTGIRYACIVSSADGVVFDVGSECVNKVDPELYKQYRAMKREERLAALQAARAAAYAADGESREARRLEAQARGDRNENEFRAKEPSTAALIDMIIAADATASSSFPGDYARKCWLNIREDGLLADLNSRECSDCKNQLAADNLVRARLRGMRAEIRATGHIGNIGKRETFEAKYAARAVFDTQWGTTCVYKFEVARADGTHALVIWKTSSALMVGNEIGCEYGTRLKITATIKEHTNYRGVSQTSVNRVKAEKV